MKIFFILICSFVTISAKIGCFKLLSYQTPYTFLKESKAQAFTNYLNQKNIPTTITTEVLPTFALNYIVQARAHFEPHFMNTEAIKDFQLEKLANSIPTYTTFGSWGLYELLCKPLTHLKALEKRSTLLKTIAHDAALRTTLIEQLNNVNAQPLLDYWQPELNPLHREADKLYFSNFFNNSVLKNLKLRKQSLNKNTAALSLSNNLAFLAAGCKFLAELGWDGIVSEIASNSFHKSIELAGKVGGLKTSISKATEKQEDHGYLNGILIFLKDNLLYPMKEGLIRPLRTHMPHQHLYKEANINDVNTFPLIESGKLSGGDWNKYFSTKYSEIMGEKTMIHQADLEEWSAPYVKELKGQNIVLDIISKQPAHLHAAALSLTCAYIGLYDISMLFKLYTKGKEVASLYTINNKLHAHLVKVAEACTHMRELAQTLHDNNLSDLPGAPELYDILIVRKNNSAKLNELLELFNSSTLTNKSVWHSKGVVLRAHKLLRSIKHELIPVFQAIGKIDAMLSVVNVYSQAQSSHAAWCFPEFDDAQTQVKLENFWNPHLSTLQAVTNSISFGNGAPRNSVFSGPNGGGKSTSMEAIGLSILLAQSWGIVPAKAARLSAFEYLRTYLAPQAQIDLGMSTFMAEKKLLDAIMSHVTNLSDDQRIFIMLDEPLRGTIEREAAHRIFNLGLQLAPKTNCCCIIATHIEKPTELAQETNQFANYHMQIEETDKSFIRTFKLIPGAAVWWFHDDIKRARFIDSAL